MKGRQGKLLTEEKVVEIRQRYAAGDILMRQLAEEFGVSLVTVHDVVARKTWSTI